MVNSVPCMHWLVISSLRSSSPVESACTFFCRGGWYHPAAWSSLYASVQILAGAVVVQGEMDARVTATGRNSFFGRTLALLDVKDEKGHLQKVSRALTSNLLAPALVSC